jgi:hypothetical protein
VGCGTGIVVRADRSLSHSILIGRFGSEIDDRRIRYMPNKTVKDGWSMLMKFGSEKNLRKLQAVQLYMKNLKYYCVL